MARTKDPGDPANRAQDLGVIFGKMLRIDPRGSRKQGDRYTVPKSNPFVKDKDAQPGDLGVRPAQPVALVLRPPDP